jgi:hypothetical protein
MGEYYKKHGTTKIGDFLRKTAPHITDIVGDILPDSGALGVVKNLIQKDKKLTIEQKNEALKILQFDLENTKDARAMQVAALGQEDIFSKRFVYYLASFWSLVTVIYIFMTTFLDVVNERVADTVLGFLLGTIVATIINYFFGSSQGSKDKSMELLKK